MLAEPRPGHPGQVAGLLCWRCKLNTLDQIVDLLMGLSNNSCRPYYLKRKAMYKDEEKASRHRL
jgi:hypothetical protein